MQVGTDGSFLVVWLANNTALCNSVAPGGSRPPGLVKPGNAGVTAEGARALLSTITAAMLAGKTVSVYANSGGAYPHCQVDAIEITP